MKERIQQNMAAIFGVDPKEINSDFNPDTREIWDSLRHMQLVVSLEEEFGIEFNEDEIPELLSLQQILQVISTKLEEPNQVTSSPGPKQYASSDQD